MKKSIVGYSLLVIMAVILFCSVDRNGARKTEANFVDTSVLTAERHMIYSPVVTSVSVWDLQRFQPSALVLAASEKEMSSGGAESAEKLSVKMEQVSTEPQEDEDNGTEPTAEPTETPEGTEEPAAVSTEAPEDTLEPTAEPTETPEDTLEPTAEPTEAPEDTLEPTAEPTETPVDTLEPTAEPTETPGGTPEPTVSPTVKPTTKPTPKPTVTPTPTPDMTLQVKQKKNNITVSWKGGSSAAYYKVWKKSPGKSFRSVKKLKKKKYTFNVPTAAANTVKVVAYNKKGKKLAVSQKVRIVIPAKLLSVSCTYWGNNKVKLSWSKSQKADSYRIYRKTITQKSYQLLATSKNLTWTDKNAKRKKNYQYKVVPVRVSSKLTFVGETSAKKKFTHKKIVATGHQKYTYQEMSVDIKELQEKFPAQLHYEIIGYSEDGRAIYDVILGNQNASKSFLVVSAIHAREYMTSLLAMNQIEYYLENYHEKLNKKSLSRVLSKIAIHFIPMANPDGVMISQKGISAIRDKALRKTLKKMAKGVDTQLWKANARGVDLNRNFAISFKKSGKAGALGYTGKKANSEKESQAIVSLLTRLKGKGLQAAVNYHATGSIIFGGGPFANAAQKKQVTKMYELAREITGYGSSATYESQTGSGNGLREYIMKKKKVPSITLEIGKIACPGPISEFSRIWKENQDLVFREALLFV